MRALFNILIIVAFSSLVFGQTSNTGTLVGTISDPTGAVIPGVEIRLRDASTAEERTTITNESGQYTFVGLRPGTYSLTASLPGFQQAVVPSVQVAVSRSVTINVTLKLGQASEQVEVVAAPGAELQTMDATVGNTIGGDTLMLLPTQQRNVTSLLLLQPAAMPQQGPQQGSGLGGQVAGARSDQNVFMLDGGNITSGASGNSDYWANFNGGPEGPIPTPVESIEEFKVATNNQTASFSGSSGSQVMLVTKRGTNAYHGSIYEFLQNDNLNANTWDRNRLNIARPESKDNRFGASLGGYIPRLRESLKTYFYFNYEGRRLSNIVQVRRTVPTDTLKQGILRFRDASGSIISYDLATSSLCGPTGNSACDPRGIGLNPLVRNIWNQYLPAGNDPTGGDGLNTTAFSGPANLPITNNFFVGRIDHSFGKNWQLMSSYRWFNEVQSQNRQIDIGGLVAGGTKGVAHATAVVPRRPRFLIVGLTAELSSTATNELHFSFLRDFWNWDTAGAIPQVPGTAAALEIGGESADALIPANVNATGIRTRTWKSHHWTWSDNFSKLTGTHLLQFGGSVNYSSVLFHREDGQTSVLQPVYIITQSQGVNIPTNYRPPTCGGTITTNCLPTNQVNNWNSLYANVLGLVDSAAMLRTRDATLNLNPEGTPIYTDTSFKNYSLYFSDSWRVRSDITLNYGLNWSVSMPPLEKSGKLSLAVDPSGKVIDPNQYLDARRQSALQGKVYNPTVSFQPIRATGRKYPFDPVWNTFAPRVAIAWNVDKKTVVRGGFARLYDRLNGVQTIIDPQQGFGFAINLQCLGPSANGQCLGNAGTDPRTAFRPGIDGSTITLPAVTATAVAPITPGVTGFPGANAAFTTSSYHLDPTYRPAPNNTFDLTVQRELAQNTLLELGYIRRTASHLFSSYQANQVPFFMTYGGQSFAQAFDNVSAQIQGGRPVTAQPFFEASLAGSSFCAAPNATCTAGVVSRFGSNFSTLRVRDLWNGIQNSFVFGPATAATNQLQSLFYYNSQGISNYNGGFVSLRQRLSQGLTVNANFTYSHSLDENGRNQTSDNAFSNSFDPHYDYGNSVFDRKCVFNALGSYQLPFGKGNRLLDKFTSGWSVSPIFAWYTGLPLKVTVGSGQEFGQLTANGSGAVLDQPNTFGNGVHSGVNGNSTSQVATSGNAASGGTGLNLFGDPDAVYKSFRPVLLSQDTSSGGGGQLRGMNRWNLDFSINRKFRITERASTSFNAQFFNAFNHVQFNDPGVNLQNPQTFGVITSQLNSPRAIVLGLRIDF